MKAGRLLVFEGPEGAGKTTQITRLAQMLRSREVPHRVVREPGGTPAGERIRALLLDDPSQEVAAATEALLFLASRAEHVSRVLRPALEDGMFVIADRFFLSTYAYQIGGRGLPEEPVRAANALATGGLRPDLTLLLKGAADGLARADRRGTRDRMERADDAFHQRVATAFEQFDTAAWQHDHLECGPIASVDASGTPDMVYDQILGVLTERWPETFAVLRGSDRL